MKAQKEWEDLHLQIQQVTLTVQKARKEATKTSHRVIKTQKATGEMVKKQQ